jgi:hypothetical protein
VNLYAAAARPGRDTPVSGDVRSLLHSVGLCSTRQRIALASLLLRTPKRRITAEIVYNEAHEARCAVSKATVFNALRQFEQAGLLRRITVDRSKKARFVIADANADGSRRALTDYDELDTSQLGRRRLFPKTT